MIEHLRQAERELGRPCRVLMDVAGPKLRTGELTPGPQVVKWRPQRDLLGRVVCPARIWLTAAEEPHPAPVAADASLPVAGAWLKRLRPGARIMLNDTRGRSREMFVTEYLGVGVWAQSPHTAYVRTGTLLRLPSWQKRPRKTAVGELPARLMPLVLRKGDLLTLTDGSQSGCAALEADGRRIPAQIPCTLPQVFADVRAGEPVWFDDGRIGGVLREVHADHALVEILHAADSGATLGPDKGINLPESTLRLPSLTPEDRSNLEFIVQHADLVGYSFVRTAEDVYALLAELARLKGEHLGIILKIETRQAFEHLPNLLLAGMRHPSTGVMIARGDLAIECGYERLAEVQEEILWMAEAAHVPVVWATQVLESLAKRGVPSRAEITDAAMGERAECVMLNKGLHIVEAVAALHDILKRMEAHQTKKRPMFRPLRLADRFGSNEAHAKSAQ